MNKIDTSLYKKGVTTPKGFLASGVAAGIKPSGKRDVCVIASEVPCSTAAVFTTNQVVAEPIAVNQKHLKVNAKNIHAVVINAGNANAATGIHGTVNAEKMCAQVGELIGCKAEEVLVCSTGIIGVPLPMKQVEKGIVQACQELTRGEQANYSAAHAIMTTDLVTKSKTAYVNVGGKRVSLSGICKGSGMIAPNLATMLAFITTDAKILPSYLKKVLKQACASSFNRMSVDQHTSCSDAVIIMANGLSGTEALHPGHEDWQAFVDKLTSLCKNLSEQIVRDGEGATRIFEVLVSGADNEKQADLIGQAVVNSPLVKCAVYGKDPNWGRIVTAAGFAGVKMQVGSICLSIGIRGKKPICVYENGMPVPLTTRQTNSLNVAMGSKEIAFHLKVGKGPAEVSWLGCDLSYDYVRINAEYTT